MTKRNIFISAFLGLTVMFGGMAISEPVLAQNKCGGADTSIIKCDGEGEDAIFGIISDIIKVMTGLIGLVAVGAVVYGAILYGSSSDSPEGVKKAKDIWMNVAIGLIAFAFMFAILNFIIPGGAWQ